MTPTCAREVRKWQMRKLKEIQDQARTLDMTVPARRVARPD